MTQFTFGPNAANNGDARIYIEWEFNASVQSDNNVHTKTCYFYINNASGSKAVEVTYDFRYQYDSSNDEMSYWVDFNGSSSTCTITAFTAPTSPSPYV